MSTEELKLEDWWVEPVLHCKRSDDGKTVTMMCGATKPSGGNTMPGREVPMEVRCPVCERESRIFYKRAMEGQP